MISFVLESRHPQLVLMYYYVAERTVNEKVKYVSNKLEFCEFFRL